MTRRVRADAVTQFEQAVRAFIPESLAFDGHAGVLLAAPIGAPDTGWREYSVLLRFRDARSWRAFQAWPRYRSFLETLRPMLVEEPLSSEVHGLEAWFDPPDRGVRPAVWKMAVLTWLGVNLTAYTLTLVMTPAIKSWPFALSFVTFNAGVVAGLTWVVMPLLTKLAHGWLKQ